MLMRAHAGEEYISLRDHDCFGIIYDSLDAFARGEIKQLLHHLPPGHFRTSLAITVALYLLARYPRKHIAYIVVDRDAVKALVELTTRLLSFPKLRSLFPQLAYRRNLNQFLFQNGGSMSFFVFKSSFNVDLVDTIILDEPQKPEDARASKKAQIDRKYVEKYFLATRGEKQILLLSSRMSPYDLAAAFDMSLQFESVAQNDTQKQFIRQFTWPAVTKQSVEYSKADGTWVRPQFHVLCEELCSFAGHVDIARRIGSFEYLTRYLQMPSGVLSDILADISPESSRAMPSYLLIQWVFGSTESLDYVALVEIYNKERG